MECNITDTALIFEGGGMRASYTCAVANILLEQGIYFNHVYGVSAGSSNAVNYVSRDEKREHGSFTTIANDPDFGGIKTFLQHKGMFNVAYLYGTIADAGGAMPFDFSTFNENPAEVTIAATERESGRTVYWSKRDFADLHELMIRVRASSTLPLVMPPPKIDGNYYYDGGLGENHGMLISQAERDGYERFFIVRTRQRGFRKPEAPNPLAMALFWRRPAMRAALRRWGPEYNETCSRIERLVDEGRAYVFYAEEMTAENSTGDYALLEKNYDAGYRQGMRELGDLKAFLGIA